MSDHANEAAYAVAHTPAAALDAPSDLPQDTKSHTPNPSPAGQATPEWPQVPFGRARERLARGVLVYRVAEVVALLEAHASALEAEALDGESRRAALQVSRDGEAAQAPRARAEEMCRIVERVRCLVDRDVATARALRWELSVAAGSYAKGHDHEYARSQACAEGAAVVQRCLIPRCVTWSGSMPPVTEGELDLLARVMAGVPDVRLRVPADGAPTLGLPIVRPVSRDEWRAMLAADDARRPTWDQPRGVVLFRPDEVAELLDTEARLYEEAAERLRRTRGCDGDGEALGHLAADLRREVPRVRALAPGDVHAARTLLTAMRREQRHYARARRRALWRRSVAHLDVVAEIVEDFLLPLEVDGPGYERSRGGVGEREVYRRWEAGALDVRDAGG